MILPNELGDKLVLASNFSESVIYHQQLGIIVLKG
jgi:hypothetical protein